MQSVHNSAGEGPAGAYHISCGIWLKIAISRSSIARASCSPMPQQPSRILQPKFPMRTARLAIVLRRRIDVKLEAGIQKMYWITEHHGDQ